MGKIIKKKPLQIDQQGMVSFVVTLLIMIVLSLIVIGFARLTRREQQQSLDRQLQTQAFYAAESGINDAVKILKDNPSAPDKDSCSNTTLPWDQLKPDLDPDGTVKYTCILVKTAVSSIEFDEIDADSKIVPINYDGGSNIDTINLEWQNSDSSVSPAIGNCDPNGSAIGLPASTAWACSVGLLRIDIVPTPSSFTRADLLDNMMTTFLYPKNGGAGTANYSSASGDQGSVIEANCPNASPVVCRATISNLGASSYMVRIRSIYRPSRVVITPVDSSKRFKGAQAIIDATGKANDVLRRIQVRKPIGTVTDPLLADFTIEADDICKRYAFVPGATGSVSSSECPALP